MVKVVDESKSKKIFDLEMCVLGELVNEAFPNMHISKGGLTFYIRNNEKDPKEVASISKDFGAKVYDKDYFDAMVRLATEYENFVEFGEEGIRVETYF